MTPDEHADGADAGGDRRHATAVPIFPVRDLGEAAAFWSRVPRLTVDVFDNGYAFVRHLGAELLHLGEYPRMDPGANFAGCYVLAPGIDALHAEFVAAGLPVTAPRDEPWGLREFRMTDPCGNVLRVGCGDEVHSPTLTGRGEDHPNHPDSNQ